RLFHTVCRSCIVKYLKCNKYCPRCKSYNSKPITVANLRPDPTLAALVYKLVPGLHKSENQRIVQFYASISSTIVPSDEDDPDGQGTYQLLDDQNYFSPDEPISLSLEYHHDTLAEHNAGGTLPPITYLQCPAAVSVHHLYKFILTKNGLQVGSDSVRVEIIYEDEILPHDFTLMDVAYCYDYKRIAPMRFFYRILIHTAPAKLAPTASAYHRVEGQDKNSTNSSGDGATTSTASRSPASDSTTTVKTAPTVTGVTDGQRTGSSSSSSENGKVGRGQGGKPVSRAPREEVANNSAPVAAINGHNRAMTTSSDTSNRSSKTPSPKAASPKAASAKAASPKAASPKAASPSTKVEPIVEPANDAKRSPPPLKAIQASATLAGTVPTVAVEQAKPSAPSSVPKCYVNLKKQTVVEGPAPDATVRKQPAPAEIPRLKIDLKAKLSVPREKTPALSPPSSSNSSAATSPSSAASSAGKSPVWPMGKEEYAKTIGLKPVYAQASLAQETQEAAAYTGSSSHRKRKKGKHSKEAGSGGKRRKLHAEISSQHDESLKMKVKITEKPPKHERRKSAGTEEDTTQPKSPPASVVHVQPLVPPTPAPPAASVAKLAPKVIDITKDDDEVKFVKERKVGTVEKKVPTPPPPPPPQVAATPPAPATPAASVPKDALVTSASTSTTSKETLNEMRNVRHKPMVYIPNLDRSLSADAPGASSSINSLLESVGAKVPMLKQTPALIPTSTAGTSGMAGKSQPRAPILARPMPSCPPLAYPMASSPVTSSSTSGSIRTMAAPSAIKRSISTESAGGNGTKVARLEPPSLVAPVSLMPPAKHQPIQAPMFNFAKGANRAKAAQQAAGITPSLPEHVPYRSPISATYTKEIPVAKKPVPNLLLPPATVSVTKMSDIVSSTSSSPASAYENGGRPAVEILRIPPNAPVADKPTLAPFATTVPKVNVKTTRPPPATIPLIKIKKPTGSAGSEPVSSGVNLPGMTPISVPIRPKVPVRSGSDPTASLGNPNILDLSGASGTGRRLSDDVIILDNSPVKNVQERARVVDTGRPKTSSAVSYAPVKRPPEMINFPTSTSVSTMAAQGPTHTVQKTLAPLPKLTEINRHRSMTVRQPNASIRSIPNPSALAFRGTPSSVPTSSVSSSAHSAGMLGQMSTYASSSAQQSNGGGVVTASSRTNGNAPLTAVKPGASLSNGAAARPQVSPMAGISSTNSTAVKNSIEPKSINGDPTNNNNNNNNSKVANANTGLSAKKTIEKVAAVLKAAAATVTDTTSSSGSSSQVSKTPAKEGNKSPSASLSTAAVDNGSSSTLSVTTAMSTANRSKATSDGIVTSVTTAAPSVTSVTGTNGSSRTSPASIVNVG
uniref:RAWUL domain-containing protein n=1 Tax=Anopheles farauti TaxID=69004 RepID=A0A182Q8D9_9DIPT